MTDRFEPVREVFRDLIDTGRDVGAGLSIWHEGHEVVCMSGGTRNAAGDPWTDDTLVHTYSVGKPIAALTALIAVARGQLTLDRPLGDVWPAFGVSGKETTTLRHVLSHCSGQPHFPASAADIDVLDMDGLIHALEASPPETAPGASIAEHALTYGHLIEGALRAAGAGTVAGLLREIADDAGWDLHFGLDESDLSRVADLAYLTPDWPEQHGALAVSDGTRDLALVNSERWRRASFPAIGLHTTASALAKFYWQLTREDGPVNRTIGPRLLREYTYVQASGFDHFLERHADWTLGFQLDDGDIAMGGLGGSSGWYAPGLAYSLAYVTRGLGGHDRSDELWHATVECLS